MILLDIVFNKTTYGVEENSFLYDVGKDYGLPILLGVVAGFLAYYIFVLESRRDRKNEENKKTDERYNKLLYFTVLIEGIIDVSRQQCGHLKDYVAEMNKDFTEFNLLTWAPINDIKRTNTQLNLEEYLLSYVDHYKLNKKELVHEFKSIIAAVDFLDSIFEQIIEQLKNAQRFDYERKLELQRLHAVSYKIVPELIHYYGPINGADAMALGNIIFILNSTKNNGVSDIEHYYNYFFVPINDFCVQRINANSPQLLLDLATFTRDGKQIYAQIISQNKSVIDDISSDLIVIEKNIEKMENKASKLLKEFDSKEKKSSVQ